MAERISPDHPGFRRTFLTFQLRKGFIPWICTKRNPFRTAFFKRYAWVSKYSKNAEVLDVPCGMGWGTSLIKGTKSVVGIDIDKESIEQANSLYADSATFQEGSMSQLEFENESFDLVVCLEGIEHVSKDIAMSFIDESFRVLKSGGKLLVSSPHTESGEHSGNPYHIHEYQTEEMKEVLKRRFEIIEHNSSHVSNLIVDFFACQKPITK